jgi:hypothetical protein
VDTHAASHTLALITAGTGAAGPHAQFPSSPAGLRRAIAWIQRHTQDATTLIVIDGTGSYGAILTEQLVAANSSWLNTRRARRVDTRKSSPADQAVQSAYCARALRDQQQVGRHGPFPGGVGHRSHSIPDAVFVQ